MARRRGQQAGDQRCVVVRVDWVIYAFAGVIVILAVASACWPGRVELSLIGTLCTLLSGVLGGWLAYMRLSRGRDDGDAGDEEGGE